MNLTKSMTDALWKCKQRQIAGEEGVRYYGDTHEGSLNALRKRGLLDKGGITAAGEQALAETMDDYEAKIAYIRQGYRFDKAVNTYYVESYNRVEAALQQEMNGVGCKIDDHRIDWELRDGRWTARLSIMRYHDFTVTPNTVKVDITLKEGQVADFMAALNLALRVQVLLQVEYDNHGPKRTDFGLSE